MTGGKFTLGEAIVGLQFNVNVKEMNAAMRQINLLAGAIKTMNVAGSIAPGQAIAQATATAIQQGQAIIEAVGKTSDVVVKHLTNLANAANSIVERLLNTINRLGETTIPQPAEQIGPVSSITPTQSPDISQFAVGPPTGGGGGGAPNLPDMALLPAKMDNAMRAVESGSLIVLRIWNQMNEVLGKWLERSEELRRTFAAMGVNARNMNAFLQATEDMWERKAAIAREVSERMNDEQRAAEDSGRVTQRIMSNLRHAANAAKDMIEPTTRTGKLHKGISDWTGRAKDNIRRTIPFVKRKTELTGIDLKLAKQQAQVNRRRARDMLGAAFALTIFGQKLQRLYTGLVEGSSDLALIQEDIASRWEDIADTIGGDVAPILEGPIANAFEEINEAVDNMNEGFRGNLGLFVLLGTQTASLVGPMIAMLATRKMMAASAAMELFAQKQITDETAAMETTRNKFFQAKQRADKKDEHKQSKKRRVAEKAGKTGLGFMKNIGKMLGGFLILGILIQLMEPFLEIITSIVDVVVDALLPMIEAIADGLVEWGIIDVIGKLLVGAFEIIIGIAKILFGWIEKLVHAIMGNTLSVALELIIKILGFLMTPLNLWLDVMKIVWNFIKNSLDPILGILKNAIMFVAAPIVILITHWRDIWEVMKSIGTYVQTIFVGAWNILKEAIGFVVNILTLDFAGAMDSISGIFENVIGFITNVIDAGFGVLQKVLEAFGNIIGVDLTGAFNMIKGIFDNTVGFVLDLIKNGLGILMDLFTTIADFLRTGDWKKAWEGLKDLFKRVVGWILDIILGPIKKLWDILTGIWNKLKDILGIDDDTIEIDVVFTEDAIRNFDQYDQAMSDQALADAARGGATGPNIITFNVDGNMDSSVVPEIENALSDQAFMRQKRYGTGG